MTGRGPGRHLGRWAVLALLSSSVALASSGCRRADTAQRVGEVALVGYVVDGEGAEPELWIGGYVSFGGGRPRSMNRPPEPGEGPGGEGTARSSSATGRRSEAAAGSERTRSEAAQHRLVAVEVAGADRVRFRTRAFEAGRARERTVEEGLPLLSGIGLYLEPGGTWMVASGFAERPERGTRLPVTLRFADDSALTREVEVVGRDRRPPVPEGVFPDRP